MATNVAKPDTKNISTTSALLRVCGLMAGAKKFIDTKLKQRRMILISKSYSPECKQVKEMLRGYDIPAALFDSAEIEQRQDCAEIEHYLQILCFTDRREVPQLFIDGQYVGGEARIRLMHNSGELEKLLIKTGIISNKDNNS